MKADDRILTIVAEIGPVTGAEVWQELGWRKWFTNVTSSLWRLESKGLVRSKFVDGPYPRRRLYEFVRNS